MPIKNNFKPASVFAVVLCGLATLSATAIGAPQSNGVILLQPQTGTKLNQVSPETVSRVKRQGFVPQSIQGSPKVSAEPIASVPFAPATKQIVDQPNAQLMGNRPVSPAVENSPSTTTLKNNSAVINNQDSIVRTTIESPKFVNLNKPAIVKINLENTGRTPVGQVEFLVALPKAAKLVLASPEPTMVDGQMLQFNLRHSTLRNNDKFN